MKVAADLCIVPMGVGSKLNQIGRGMSQIGGKLNVRFHILVSGRKRHGEHAM